MLTLWIIRTVSGLSGQFPPCFWKDMNWKGQYLPLLQKLSGQQCGHSDKVFLTPLSANTVLCYLSPPACNLLSASPLIAPINLSRPVVINSTPGLAFLCLEIPIPNKWISSSVDDLLGGKLSGLDQIGGEADLLSCLDSAVRLVRLIDGANKHSQILGTGGGGGNLGNALKKTFFFTCCVP